MINIFFVPGMFGSTLEYMLRNFTQDFEKVDGYIINDGSLHSFGKEFHPINFSPNYRSNRDFVTNFSPSFSITTPIYPMADKKLHGILNDWPGDLTTSKNIFIHADTVEDAELNMLFQFYKISKGVLRRGLDIFCSGSEISLSKWNQTYTFWDQLTKWELREWLSLYYKDWISEWVFIDTDIKNIKSKLIISNREILNNLETTFLKIVDYCELTPTLDHKCFITEWTEKQQYILNEFWLIQKIIDATINKQALDWQNEQLCFLSECIIQGRLRLLGYEIKCYTLNEFPTNSFDLHSILEKL